MTRPEDKARNKEKLSDEAPRTNQHFSWSIGKAILLIDSTLTRWRCAAAEWLSRRNL